jgi:hypothetical protein
MALLKPKSAAVWFAPIARAQQPNWFARFIHALMPTGITAPCGEQHESSALSPVDRRADQGARSLAL